MKRFKTGVLVRNNRLKHMQDKGITVKHEVLSDAEYIAELKIKLVEEANEALNSIDAEELKHEIADVMEVLECLTVACKFSPSEIAAIKQDKKNKIGGFDQRIKTHYVEMPDGHQDVAYYRAQPHKYPEVAPK